jgi:YNFM family putative membrane transporter
MDDIPNPIHGGPIRRGTAGFHRTNLAMFAAGFANFALLYGPQPLMPLLAQHFQITPAASSLVMSMATISLALALLVAGALSDALGRKAPMILSLAASGVLTLISAGAVEFSHLLALRLLMGIAMSGIPSIALAYLAEEMEGRSVGLAMGLFIGGSAFGGMSGRLITSILADFGAWRLALALLGGSGLISAGLLWRFLPDSRHFQPVPLNLGGLLGGFTRHLTEAGLPWLYGIAFLSMGCFVTVYNYIGFRLGEPPFSLGQGVVGALFSVYLLGIVASTGAGHLADRIGRRRMLWAAVLVAIGGVVLTRSDHLALIVAGVALVTIGFFGGHAIASSWVGRRARVARGQAGWLYMFFYYLGSSVIGVAGGLVYADHGWGGLSAALLGLEALALLIAIRLWFLPPLPENARMAP